MNSVSSSSGTMDEVRMDRLRMEPRAGGAPSGTAVDDEIDVTDLQIPIEQAAGFARGEDYTGAVARIDWAYERLRTFAEESGHEAPAVQQLLRVAEGKKAEYRRLLREWQENNARRRAAYVSRELGAIGTFSQ